MKISQDLRPVVDKGKRTGKGETKEPSPFAAFVGEHETKLRTEALDHLFSQIEKQGEALIRTQTIHEFRVFKRYVQRFMNEAVQFGLEVKQSYNWHHHGGAKTFKRVDEIDNKLIEMTEVLLKKEHRPVDLLDKIGEIKGLLINLYH